MKFLTLSAFALVSLVFPAVAQVPVRPGDVKIDKIIPAVVKTPEYQITGGANKRYKLGDWLEVEVEFTTIPEMIDELTFNYKILVNGKLLVGEITHMSIPKGKEHYSVAYVSPRSLDSILLGKTLTSAAIQGIWVEVSKQGMLLAQQTTSRGAVPNVPQVPGMVLNKSLTPFALLYWDRYEALKPGASR
jgi:hypothetical protein